MSGSFWFGFGLGLSAGLVTIVLLKKQRKQPTLEETLLGPQQPAPSEDVGTTPASLADAIQPT